MNNNINKTNNNNNNKFKDINIENEINRLKQIAIENRDNACKNSEEKNYYRKIAKHLESAIEK